MKVKVFDSELKVMELLWEGGEVTASQLAKILKEQTGWNPNTTYTVLKKLVDKGAIERFGSNFSCRALIKKEQIQQDEARELVGKLFDGSAELFLSAFFGGQELSGHEIDRLKRLVENLREKEAL